MADQQVEEKLAHVERAVDELSAVVARQDAEIALLNRRVAMLMEREAEREAAETSGVAVADRAPPHY